MLIEILCAYTEDEILQMHRSAMAAKARGEAAREAVRAGENGDEGAAGAVGSSAR
ncbi:hypothetical protein IFR05_001401 [Cadophora sp. M221]|nr:hypothetical protein IFR05_001401 [Cadophora sp. M221]